MTRSLCERVLETYSLEDIIELNDLTDVDILEYLLEQEYLKLPKVMPVDLDD